MAAVTITRVAPASGHTGGQTLVEITGTGFRVPDFPPAGGAAPDPTVRVTFGGEEATVFGIVDDTTILVLTPSHDESGVPATANNQAIAPSDVTVENLDDDGSPISGESAAQAEAFSFRKPILNVPTTGERVIDALLVELQRQLPRGVDVVFDPHTDYDDTTGDALNHVQFSKLPGVGLTGLRTPPSQIAGERAEEEVEIDDDRSVTRRPPIKRDLLLTVVMASDNRGEILRLSLCVQMIFEKLTKVRITKNVADADRGYAEYDALYAHGELTYGDRQATANVMVVTGELRIVGVEETDMLGAPEAGLDGAPSWLAHEATTGVVWRITAPSPRVVPA